MVSPKDHIMIVWYQASFTVVITHYDVIIIIKYSHACLMWPESGHKLVLHMYRLYDNRLNNCILVLWVIGHTLDIASPCNGRSRL